jgi:hypothetical protein
MRFIQIGKNYCFEGIYLYIVCKVTIIITTNVKQTWSPNMHNMDMKMYMLICVFMPMKVGRKKEGVM